MAATETKDAVVETTPMKATVRAGSNIAFIKYWGVRDPALFLPLSNSISMTLADAFTTTTVEWLDETTVETGCPLKRPNGWSVTWTESAGSPAQSVGRGSSP